MMGTTHLVFRIEDKCLLLMAWRHARRRSSTGRFRWSRERKPVFWRPRSPVTQTSVAGSWSFKLVAQ
jgi:hypothetical protein